LKVELIPEISKIKNKKNEIGYGSFDWEKDALVGANGVPDCHRSQ
jgi:hypothetical protein